MYEPVWEKCITGVVKGFTATSQISPTAGYFWNATRDKRGAAE